MAFFKAKVLRQRKDGMYVVYIRVTQNRKSKYIRTSWVIDSMGLCKDKLDIIDPFVAEQTSKVISGYYNTLNRICTRLDGQGNRGLYSEGERWYLVLCIRS